MVVSPSRQIIIFAFAFSYNLLYTSVLLLRCLPIKEILSTVNEKYLKGLRKKITRSAYGSHGSRIYCRYSGYQFQVSKKTIDDELTRRWKNDRQQ